MGLIIFPLGLFSVLLACWYFTAIGSWFLIPIFLTAVFYFLIFTGEELLEIFVETYKEIIIKLYPFKYREMEEIKVSPKALLYHLGVKEKLPFKSVILDRDLKAHRGRIIPFYTIKAPVFHTTINLKEEEMTMYIVEEEWD